MNKLYACLLLLIGLVGSASADQAAYISKDQAEQAVAVLTTQSTWRQFCEPCGDTMFEQDSVYTVQAVFTNYESFYEVAINEQPVDLAYVYTYDKTSEQWVNLAIQLGIAVEGVSAVLSE